MQHTQSCYDKQRDSFSLPRDTHKIKILVVEDSPLIQFALSSMLEDLGYSFDVAVDGSSAIEFAQSTTDYALVFMNINLPDISGIEVTRRLRILKNTAHTPIVAMTLHTEPKYKARCYAAKMDGFYNKPNSSADIEHIIKAHVVSLYQGTEVTA